MTNDTALAPFPVEWRSPDEASLTWARDPMHFPAPVTALTASVLEGPFSDGFVSAFAELAMPTEGLRHRVINSYVYSSTRPAAPPSAMEERMRRHHAVMGQRMDDLRKLWEQEYLPAVERMTEEIHALDFADPVADLARLVDLIRQSAHIHFLVVIPKLAAGERFSEIYSRATGSANEMEPYRCLQGEPNKSLEADGALWRLARDAEGVPEVTEALERDTPEAVMAALGNSERGRGWRDQLDAVLREYGQRAAAIELASPTWLEDPTFALDNIRRYLAAGALDPEGARAAHLGERDRLVEAARARLAAQPELRDAFDASLEAARRAWPLEEDHAFYIDQRLWGAACRWAFLRLGKRLVADGRLGTLDDVFHLDLAHLAAAAGGAEMGDVARAGRRRMAEHSLLDAPPLLGAPHDPAAPMDPGLIKFFGSPGPPDVEGGVLRGSAGSAGRAEGVARVVASVDDLWRVEPGEILVCRSTTPPWTPVFASIAALVTDTGGVLAHGAIVAREYGIPAVMGTKVATRTIRDGQRVTVDGSTGEVRIVD